MKVIKWSNNRTETALFAKIADRAHKLNPEYKYLTAFMDVDACHNNGCPLDLERLLAADEFNFSHDVFGIARHINRDTGQLENCFVPRFASRQFDEEQTQGSYNRTH
jgi:hypothetical protein